VNLTIRLGTAVDAARLAEFAARLFRETFAADNRPEDIALHLAKTYGTSQQAAELADPNITTLLAEVDEQLARAAITRAR